MVPLFEDSFVFLKSRYLLHFCFRFFSVDYDVLCASLDHATIEESLGFQPTSQLVYFLLWGLLANCLLKPAQETSLDLLFLVLKFDQVLLVSRSRNHREAVNDIPLALVRWLGQFKFLLLRFLIAKQLSFRRLAIWFHYDLLNFLRVL